MCNLCFLRNTLNKIHRASTEHTSKSNIKVNELYMYCDKLNINMNFTQKKKKKKKPIFTPKGKPRLYSTSVRAIKEKGNSISQPLTVSYIFWGIFHFLMKLQKVALFAQLHAVWSQI